MKIPGIPKTFVPLRVGYPDIGEYYIGINHEVVFCNDIEYRNFNSITDNPVVIVAPTSKYFTNQRKLKACVPLQCPGKFIPAAKGEPVYFGILQDFCSRYVAPWKADNGRWYAKFHADSQFVTNYLTTSEGSGGVFDEG